MNESENYQKTHKLILSCLKEMILTEPFSKLKITSLTKKANISRGTFYIHFEDLPSAVLELENELLQQIINELKANKQEVISLTDDEKLLVMYRKITNAIDENFDLFEKLISINGNPEFLKLMKKKLSPFVAPEIAIKAPNKHNLPISLAKELIIEGIFSILQFWLTKQPYRTANEIAEYLLETRRLSPFELAGVE